MSEKLNPIERIRSTPLRILLILATFLAGYTVFINFSSAWFADWITDERLRLILRVTWIAQAVALVCLIGMWRWHKWGFYGYLGTLAVNVVFQVGMGNLGPAIFSAGILALVVYIVRPQLPLFEA